MREWLKAMRAKYGLSQTDMAERLTISPPYYCEIERGTRQPDMAYSMMEKIANALGVPVQVIIEAEKEYKSNVTKAF